MLFVLIAAALGPLTQAQSVLPVLPAQFEHRLAPQLKLTHHANPAQTIGGQTAKSGPNGWLVVGGFTVGGAIVFATSWRLFLWGLGSTDSTTSTWLQRAALGAGAGAVLGLAFCLRLGCDWSKPKAPQPPTPRRPRAAVLVGAGMLGIRITW